MAHFLDLSRVPGVFPASFRDGPKDQTRNLEIPGSRYARPGMTLESHSLAPSGLIHSNSGS